MYILYNMDCFWEDFQIYLYIEGFFTLPGFKDLSLLIFFPFPSYSWPYFRNCVPDKNIQPAMIYVMNLSFGRPTERSYRSDINQDMLLIFVFPMVGGADKVKNWKGDSSTNIYPWKNPKYCWDKYYHSKYDAKLGCMPSSTFGARSH